MTHLLHRLRYPFHFKYFQGNMTKSKALGGNVYQQRMRSFDEPFAYICINQQVKNYCSYCLRKPKNCSKLYKCSKCELARYCNKVHLTFNLSVNVDFTIIYKKKNHAVMLFLLSLTFHL